MSEQQKPEPLAPAIRRQLADEILSGSLGVNSRLDEVHLARRFGVSRTPIREAIQQLAAAGLVRLSPRRSAVVSPLDPVSIGRAFETTAELEALVAKWAAERAELSEKAALGVWRERLLQAAAEGSMEGFARINRELHEQFALLAHNESLADLLQIARTQIAPHTRYSFRLSEERERTSAELLDILSAIARGDSLTAQTAMRNHILGAGARVLAPADRPADTRHAVPPQET